MEQTPQPSMKIRLLPALSISVISANFKTLFFEAEQKKQEGAGMAAEDEVRVWSRCLPRSHPWVVSPTAY